jgi:hypothetical protein
VVSNWYVSSVTMVSCVMFEEERKDIGVPMLSYLSVCWLWGFSGANPVVFLKVVSNWYFSSVTMVSCVM